MLISQIHTKSIYLIIVSTVICALSLNAQELPSIGQDSITITPAAKYEAGTFHRFLFGDTWRDVWTSPIKVPVLDPISFAGGLKPVSKGSVKANSLYLYDYSGMAYRFRKLRKTKTRFLPDELYVFLVEDVIEELFSTTNPLAVRLASPLINAVDVIKTNAELCYLKDSPLLGEYRGEFSGEIGTIEFYPDNRESDVSIAGADSIFSTNELYRKLLKNVNYDVDDKEYLKARLLDIYLGDWDRHSEQWLWAEYDLGQERSFEPIALNRDQAFCRFDGLVPWTATKIVPEVVSCTPYYYRIKKLTWSGRHLDRSFLNSITKRKWDSLTNYVYESISDSVIEYALSLFPSGVPEEDRNWQRNVIFSRRNKLKRAAEKYYNLLFGYVDVFASNNRDKLIIDRFSIDSAAVSIFSLDGGGKDDKPYFHRIYDDKYTKELRIYMFDDRDEITVKGNKDSEIDIHIIGGQGEDKFVDNSKLQGSFLGVFPYYQIYKKRHFFYDHGSSTIFKGEVSSLYDDTYYPEPEDETLKFEKPVRDWGYKWKADFTGTFSTEDGLYLGAGPGLTKYGFRYAPYLWKMNLMGSYSFLFNGFRAKYGLHLRERYSPNSLLFDLYGSTVDMLWYFGTGNEVDLPTSTDNKDYYSIEQSIIRASLLYRWQISDNFQLTAGTAAKRVNTDLINNTYIADTNYRPANTGELFLFDAELDLKFDTRDNSYNPTGGYMIDLYGSYFIALGNNESHFGKFGTEMRKYWTWEMLTEITLASRFQFKWVFGGHPFFESAFLGGYEDLRGALTNRLSGDAKAAANIEARIKLFNFNIIVPGKLGIMGAGDIGRVFVDGEKSERWYNGYGGGIWASAIRPEYLGCLYLMKGIDGLIIYANLGFMF